MEVGLNFCLALGQDCEKNAIKFDFPVEHPIAQKPNNETEEEIIVEKNHDADLAYAHAVSQEEPKHTETTKEPTHAALSQRIV